MTESLYAHILALMRKKLRWVGTVITGCLTVVAMNLSPLAAQSVAGRISGTVVDPQDAVIPAAQITLVNEATGERQQRTTNETGLFLFPSLPPGSYSVRVEHGGFVPKERRGITLNANAVVSVGSIQLAVGKASESIQVEAAAAGVDLDNSSQNQVVSARQMTKLMAASRDPMWVMKILPGVSQQTFGQNQSIGGSISGAETYNFAGTRTKWNSVKLDGQPGQNLDQMNRFSIPIAWDAVEEIAVQPSSYLAEHGRSSGVHINVISKSGTNQFHGTAYYFKRHEQFNANSFFNNRNSLPRPLGRYNSFGGTVGGPVKKDKLFFFASQEWWRVTQAAPLTRATLPTDLEKAGNFSQSVEQNGRLIPIRDPFTQTPMAGNIIPPSRIDPNGRAMLGIMPTPNSPGLFQSRGFNNIMQQRVEIPKVQTQFKVDWLPSSNDRISIRPRWFSQDLRGQTGVCCSANANFAVQPHHYNFLNRGVAGTWTRTISANLVNEFSGGWFTSEERGDLKGSFDLSKYKRDQNGLDDLPQLFPEVNELGLIPGMQFGGLPNSPSLTYDDRTPIRARDDRANFQNNMNWLKGNHILKFGVAWEGQFASEGPRIGSSADLGGRFLFNRDANNPLETNHPFANALFGVFREYRHSSRYSEGAARMDLLEFFIQDSWKVSRRLSLDLGLRASWFTDWRLRNPDGAALSLENFDPAKAPAYFEPARNAANRRVARNPVNGELAPTPYIGAFVPGSGDRFNGIARGGVPGLGNRFRGNPPVQWQPRLGFAYDLTGRGTTVIRGGAGVFTQAIFSSGEGVINSNVVTGPSVVESPNIFFSTISDLRDASGVFFPTNNVFAFNPEWTNVPTVYKWSFGIQQKLPADMVLDTAYVGNTGRHLRQSLNINALPPGTRFLPSSLDSTTNRPLPDNFLRPYQGYGNISLRAQDVGYSNYNSLQVSLNRRSRGRLQYGLAYTWSKAMGLSDDDSNGLPMFTDYRTYLYGKLGFDQTHVLTLNYLYEIPNLRVFGNSAFSQAIFDGWSLSGISTFASGFPSGIGLSYADGVDRHGGGDAPRLWVRENPVLSSGERTFSRWFNTGAFEAPGRLEFGNAPRDVFRRPGINNFDVTFGKTFRVTERVGLQFRSEFYNFFNHTQFDNVDTSARFDSRGVQINNRFGEVISTRPAREIQFSLRLQF